MADHIYCCDLMARWVSNPRGANAPPEDKLTQEYDFPSNTWAPHRTHLNTALGNNDDVLVHHDPYEDYGIVGRGNWRNSYVGIAFCPWCGRKLGTDKRVVGKMMAEFEGQFTDFDQRELSIERYREDFGIFNTAWLIEQGIPYTKAMSDIEVLIRIQGKYRDDSSSRYSNYPGRAMFDFDKEWPPKELAVIAQFCAENGQRDPDLALWKLLCMADQPAVWALALLDLAANEIPELHHIYFELRPNDQPCIVIQTRPVRSKREEIAFGEQLRGLMSKIKGYDIRAGEPTPFEAELDADLKAYAKLITITGYLPDASNIEEGILCYLVAPYFRDDVLRFMHEKYDGSTTQTHG